MEAKTPPYPDTVVTNQIFYFSFAQVIIIAISKQWADVGLPWNPTINYNSNIFADVLKYL